MVVYAGQRIRAGDIPYTYWKQKTGVESVTSSAVLQNDDDLFVDLEVGTYRVQINLTAGGATAGDIRVAWTNTGTMSLVGRICHGPAASAADTDDTNARMTALAIGSNAIYGTGATSAGIYEDLTIEVTVAGRLQMQWAQGTSSGTATTLSGSSRMFVTKVEDI